MTDNARSAEPAGPAPRELSTARAEQAAPAAAGLSNLAIQQYTLGGGSLAGFPGAPLDNQSMQRLARGGAGAPSVQLRRDGNARTENAKSLDAAKPALAGASQPLPHFDQIQAAFGRHDLSEVRTITGGPARGANESLGARAFTAGDRIGFRDAPSPWLTAHEAAHVIQQRDGTSTPGGSAGDPWERHADRVADAVIAGRPAEPLLDEVTRGAGGRAPPVQLDQGTDRGSPSTDKPLAPNARPSLTDQYPYLLGLLSEEDMVALEAASEHRYAKLGSGQHADKEVKALAKSVISAPLGKLLSPEARYVDVDAWDTVYGVLRGHGAPELVGSLLRNEMMRRFITRNGLSSDTIVDIKLVDPDGKVPGASQLSFEIVGTKVRTTMGQITPANLKFVVTAYPLEDAVGSVGGEADKLAMEVALIEEFETRNPQVQDRVKDQAADPQSHSPMELRALAARLGSDKQAASDTAAKAGYVAPGAENLAADFGALLDDLNGAVTAQETWLAEHQTMPTDAEMYEVAGTWFVTQGGKQWDKGGAHRVLSGLAYTGAVATAIVDGLGNLFSFGLQNDERDINKAYNRGQISWNERTDLEFAALGRAAAVGIVTIAITVATAGLGTEAAVGLGLARGTFAYGAVVVTGGAVSGTLVSASALGTKSVITGVGDFGGTQAQAIWKSGMPSATEWKWGLAMGAGFGALGAVPQALPAPGGMVIPGGPGGPAPVQTVNIDGFDIDVSHDLAVGTHPDGRVCYIRPSGAGIYNIGPDGLLVPLEEVGEGGVPRSMIAGGGEGTTAMVPYQGGPTAAPGQVPVVWNGEPLLIGGDLASTPPPSPPPMTYPGATGDQVVASFLRAKQLTGVTAPDADADVANALMRDFGTTQPQPLQPIDLTAFSLAPEPQVPLLTAGPQPAGLLTAPQQPLDPLGPTPPLVYDINPPGGYLPKIAPGTSPTFTSTKLGANLMESFGLPRKTSFSGWQPHHILPKEIATMPALKGLAINFDDPTNGILMPERDTFIDLTNTEPKGAWIIKPHEGGHKYFSTAMKEAVGAIDPTLPASIREVMLYNLQQRARAALAAGAPLYAEDGATADLWRAILKPK